MTDKEKLSCLIDRPCTACKLHKEGGCSKWSCVFDQKSELPEGEYIKKTDVLDKAVIETLSDYTEHDVVYVDEINKLPTYSVPEREKGTLEKIRTEIEEEKFDYEQLKDFTRYYGLGIALEIIDKYMRGGKAE